MSMVFFIIDSYFIYLIYYWFLCGMIYFLFFSVSVSYFIQRNL